MKNRIVRILIVTVLLVLSGLIIRYYWVVPGMKAMTKVPIYIMVLAFAYILVQIFKRYFFKEQNWWDWLYYLALLSMVTPSFLSNPDYEETYTLVTRIGTAFLLVPVVIDIRKFIL